MTGTLERCWGLLLVQAAISVSGRKKSPRVSLKLVLLLMPPQKQDPAVLCVPTEIIAFPDHFCLDSELRTEYFAMCYSRIPARSSTWCRPWQRDEEIMGHRQRGPLLLLRMGGGDAPAPLHLCFPGVNV